MSKNRYVRTKFWTDPFIIDLNEKGKLLFLYLLTNQFTNVAGIYEITIRQIAFDTSLKKAEIEKLIKIFQEKNKLYYIKSYVIIKNFQKNQDLSPKIKTAIDNIIEKLPENIKKTIDYKYPIDTISIETDNINTNTEDEIEVKKEDKKEVEEIYIKFDHLKMTVKDFEKLNINYSKELINETIQDIKNYRQNTKYKSLYLTLLKWLKKNSIPKYAHNLNGVRESKPKRNYTIDCYGRKISDKGEIIG